MSDFVIHGAPQSNFVWTVRLAAARKGVPHTIEGGFPSPGNGHPLGKIPVARHNGETFYESRAIVGYLDAAFDGPALRPADPVAAAHAEAVASLFLTAIDPVLVRQYLFAFFFPGTPDGAPDLARAEAVTEEVTRHLGILNGLCEAGELLSDPPAFADLWATPILYYMQQLPTWPGFAAKCPALEAALTRTLSRPDVVETTPPPLPAAA